MVYWSSPGACSLHNKAGKLTASLTDLPNFFIQNHKFDGITLDLSGTVDQVSSFLTLFRIIDR